ncbi:3099_t:CDS:2, partial [Dentiscutata erythropus]
CGELGHFAKNCLSEKAVVIELQYKIKKKPKDNGNESKKEQALLNKAPKVQVQAESEQEEEVPMEIFKCSPQRKYKEIRNILKPNPPECALYGIYSYEQVEFTPMGIRYDDQYCTWYYIEHISNRLGAKTKEDDCIKCKCDLRLWITIKNYPIQEVAKSYWTTPDTEDDEETTADFSKSNLGLNYIVDEYLDKTPIRLENLVVQNTGPLEEEPLKTPSKRYYEEFNNYKDTYLCNLAWWEVPNPVQLI